MYVQDAEGERVRESHSLEKGIPVEFGKLWKTIQSKH